MAEKLGLGFALSGGGARGFAHAGAIKALEEVGIYPDIIAGTSAGAIFGALYGVGYSPDEIFKLFKSKEFTSFASLKVPKDSFLDNSGLRAFFEKNFKGNNFETLKYPLITVATDMDQCKMKKMDSGNLVDAVMASSCVPIVFPPVEIEGTHYVDGGVFCNFPVSVLKKRCEMVLGINVSPLVPTQFKKSLLHIAERTYHMMSLSNTVEDRKRCDVLIEINEVGEISMFELKKIDHLFEAGYNGAKKVIEEKWSLLEKYSRK